jgi:hypothetical protein
MPTPPDLDAVKAYLGNQNAWTDDQIRSALDAETAAQARAVRLPVDLDPASPLPYPTDLAEALCRRVAHNLALRGLPLGVQANITDAAIATNRVGGEDAEVIRLEKRWRRVVVG